jgi:hypothetical protein
MIEVAKLKKGAYDDQQKVFSDIAQQKLEDAKAQHQLRLANRGRGGTGVGGGSTLDAAQAKTAAEIEALKLTKPEGTGVSYAEMSAIALKNKLPLQAKAGRPSLAGIISGEAKGASVTSAETRTAERLNQLVFTDAAGNQHTAHNLNDAKAADKSTVAFQQIKSRMQALIDDVEKNGNREITPDDVQRRNSLGAKVLAAARVYNGLGATDASQHLESLINGALGTPGNGFFIGANLGVLKDNLKEAEDTNDARIKTYERQGFPKSADAAPKAGRSPVAQASHDKIIGALGGVQIE